MCTRVCGICICVYVYTGMLAYTGIWKRSEIDVRRLPQFLSSSYSQTRSLTEYGAYLQEQAAIKLQEFACLQALPPELGLQAHNAMPSFDVDSGDLNLGPQFMASILHTEPFPQR